ncbi:hypothetical protein RB195_019824 [Necator americanus]|uniref:Uncharacterized protein n=1 Tax=Necator americanus TaxID=51031 RepID=A0ABR1CGP2_NECAM
MCQKKEAWAPLARDRNKWKDYLRRSTSSKNDGSQDDQGEGDSYAVAVASQNTLKIVSKLVNVLLYVCFRDDVVVESFLSQETREI